MKELLLATELLVLLAEHPSVLHQVLVRWLFELQDVYTPEMLILECVNELQPR